jgi:hypothetical protein
MKEINKILKICAVLLSAVVFLCAANMPAVDGLRMDNYGNKTSESRCFIYSPSDDFQCAAVNISEQTYKTVSAGVRSVNPFITAVDGNIYAESIYSTVYDTWLRSRILRSQIFTAYPKAYYIYTLRKLLI